MIPSSTNQTLQTRARITTNVLVTNQHLIELRNLLKLPLKFIMSHSHDGTHSHSHDIPTPDHGHTHEILSGPGSYMGREMPIIEGRNWSERAFTVGIGGYVSTIPILLIHK